eukprot:SAG11_NODE_14132_length_624_cov_0.771429_2_plen_60_part_01
MLTHFSSRYKPDDVAVMDELRRQAAHAAALPISNVHAARDFWTLPLPRPTPLEPSDAAPR